MTTDQLIYNTAVVDGIPDPLALFLVAQARHETGDYKSHFFTVGKNAFGYSYYSKSKWQLPSPGPLADNQAPIAQYASVQDSVHEITDWIKRRQKEGIFPSNLGDVTSPEQYATLLKNGGYYGATLQSYSAALVAWVRKIGGEAFNAKTGSLLLVIIVLGFVFRNDIKKLLP